MSAPTSAADGGGPAAGYYPDPSIPGYVRYWNGAAWVPGSSRPAPPGTVAAAASEATAPAGTAPAPGAGPVPQAAEETGPVFFDEDPSAGVADGPDAGPGQEPASAWAADTARQSGFGGDQDHRVSWGAGGPQGPGGPEGAASPSDASALSAAPATGLTGAAPLPSRTVDEGGRHGAPPADRAPVDSTAAMRALAAARRAKDGDGNDAARPAGDAPGVPGQAQGELPARAARAALPGGTQAATSAPASPVAAPPPADARVAGADTVQGQAAPAPSGYAPPPQRTLPAQPGAAPQDPAAAAPPWAQQVHRLAQGPTAAAAQAGPAAGAPGALAGGEPPVVPWKPPTEDPFQAAARAQASARPAGLGRRLLARVIDTIVVGAVVGAAAAPLALRARTHIDDKIEAARQSGRLVTVYLIDGTTGGYLAVVLAALLVVGVLYEALPTARWGRTLGKKACGLKVLDLESFEPPGFGRALARWLLYGVLGAVVVGVLNVVWCLFDRPWRQCWHDKAAHTFVARRAG